MTDQQEKRLAIIPALIEHSPNKRIGRTALMKSMYFLQTLRGVPLGYRFSLYSYGPFDSGVLADLSVAESLGAVVSETVFYPGGYGYDISLGDKSKWLKHRADDFVRAYEKDAHWVMQHFGKFTSAQLELVSTIIYVDREAADKGKKVSRQNLARQVHEIKPHFGEPEILDFAGKLLEQNLLQATVA